MLRTMLIATSLLAVSTGALAGHDDSVYGRVVSVEPHFSISFGGGGHHDGFRIRYEIGGRHYWTHSHHYPGHYIWVPRPVGHVIHHPHCHHHWHDRWDDRRDWHHNHPYRKDSHKGSHRDGDRWHHHRY